jgi:hypothetical protein
LYRREEHAQLIDALRSIRPLLSRRQLDSGVGDADVRQLLDWLQHESIATLNVAGPRKSKRSGIYLHVNELLERAGAAAYCQSTEEKIEMGAPGKRKPSA